MIEFIRVFSLAVFGYFVAIQLVLLALGIISAYVLHRDHRQERYGRVEDMLASDLAPPVSIVVAAFNETAGIVDAVRSMALAAYPRFEIVVVNDGSTDDTLQKLIDAFDLYAVPYPVRQSISTARVRAIYRSRTSLPIIVVDKENGGRADALNAAINAARYPYILATDADVIMDPTALEQVMRVVAEDRERTVAVGGNIRPLNGCALRQGNLVAADVPAGFVERYQLLEYVRAFVGSRPAWSAANCLPIISGAFGVFRRDVMVEIGGYSEGHLGEDLDLTMRIHCHARREGLDYRVAYSPSAVVWTEVPSTRPVLRRQRIRWHRGLLRTIWDRRSVLFNPRYGTVGMLCWPVMVLIEFIGPIVEALGWIVVPAALILKATTWYVVLAYFLLAFLAGLVTSFLALILDERYGYFNHPRSVSRMFWVVLLENLGLRQMTVWWRIRAMFPGSGAWGNMERRGVGELANST